MVNKAVILAAGKGERLAQGIAWPKPLKKVAGTPLIVRIIRNLERAGVKEVGIVVGFMSEVLVSSLQKYDFSARLHFFQNDEFDKPNGTSLLKAASFVREPTYLLMSDHLWSPSLLDAVGRTQLTASQAALGVDYGIDRCFDLPDATKVWVQEGRIRHIGKEIDRYNAIDTGVFLVTPALIEALRSVDGERGCSLSQGVAVLAEAGNMVATDTGDACWIDVDTPSALAQAEALIGRYGETLAPRPAKGRAFAPSL